MTVLSGVVLLAEDNLRLTAKIEALLLELGAETVLIAEDANDATEMMETTDISFAILDLKLKNSSCEPIAELCYAQGIPFLFASGYGSHGFDPKKFGNIPIVVKPYDGSDLRRAIESLQIKTCL